MPDYSNCGLESELTDEMLETLYYHITTSKEQYTIKDFQKLIYDLFRIKFSYNHAWFIARKKLGFHYEKPFITYDSIPEKIKKNDIECKHS